MRNNRSFAVCVEVGSFRIPVITLAFSTDGSFSVQDRIELSGVQPIYKILRIPFPVDKIGVGKMIAFDGPTYFSRNKPKLSHHAQSGIFQISSARDKPGFKVISGFENGQLRGVGNYSFQPHQTTNDGGPIVTGMFWGLNNMQASPVKSSESLIFLEDHLRDQTMNNRGSRAAVAVDVFHFLKIKNTLQYIDRDWARYSYRHYKRPLLTRVIDPGNEHEYLLGISCLMMRCNEKTLYGYRLGGGPGIVNRQTGNCLNTFIMFEMPIPSIQDDAINIDFQGE